MKSVLITGGGGFIGRNLINALVAGGDCKVTCLDVRDVDFFPATVRCVKGRFSDVPLMADVLQDIDTVVHLGSNALPANANYVDDVEQNLLGSITLIRACENARVSRIVFASSGGTVYGPTAHVPTMETEPSNPICSYGIIKVAIEKYLELASRNTGMRTVTLRIANPYGPWQNWNSVQGVASVFCRKIMRGEPIALFGDGSVKRDFVYIDDVVGAFVRAMEYTGLSDCFNVGSGQAVSLASLVEKLSGIVGKRAEIVRMSARSCDVPISQLDVGKARCKLGWEPITPLDDGLSRLARWQRDNPTAF